MPALSRSSTSRKMPHILPNSGLCIIVQELGQDACPKIFSVYLNYRSLLGVIMTCGNILAKSKKISKTKKSLRRKIIIVTKMGL